jgi:hypothetical protein
MYVKPCMFPLCTFVVKAFKGIHHKVHEGTQRMLLNFTYSCQGRTGADARARAYTYSCSSRNFSASSAAMQPVPAAVIAWR